MLSCVSTIITHHQRSIEHLSLRGRRAWCRRRTRPTREAGRAGGRRNACGSARTQLFFRVVGSRRLLLGLLGRRRFLKDMSILLTAQCVTLCRLFGRLYYPTYVHMIHESTGLLSLDKCSSALLVILNDRAYCMSMSEDVPYCTYRLPFGKSLAYTY